MVTSIGDVTIGLGFVGRFVTGFVGLTKSMNPAIQFHMTIKHYSTIVISIYINENK